MKQQLSSEPKEGLAVIRVNNKLYCANCGMKIVNQKEWKEIHFNFHNYGKHKTGS